MPQAANALTTHAARADTRPDLFVHPHSPEARGRARLFAEQARHCLIAAKHHRLEGRPSWSRSCLALAGVSRRKAIYEFRNARREQED